MSGKSRFIKVAILGWLALALAACGGGSGDDGSGSGDDGTSNSSVANSSGNHSSAASLGWALQLGAAGVDTFAKGIAVDTHGNIYVAGDTKGNLDGNSSDGTQDLVLAKYNSTGSRIYLTQWGGLENGSPIKISGLATDTHGNAYLVGHFDALSFQNQAFLMKFNTAGEHVYTRELGPPHTARPEGIAVDADDNVFVAGWTTSALDDATQTGVHDLFLKKFDAAGNWIFTRQLGISTNGIQYHTRANALALDGEGNAYIVGTTDSGLDGNQHIGGMWIYGGGYGSGYFEDAFLTKYDNNGNRQYTRQLGVSGAITNGYAVAVGPDGHIFVGGATNGSHEGHVKSGFYDFLLVEYDVNGIKVQTHQLGAPGGGSINTYAWDVATDADGNVYVTGTTNGSLDGNVQIGDQDIFLTKYDASGHKVRTKQMGVSGKATHMSAIATDANGKLYLVASTTGAFEGATQTGLWDMVLMQDNGSWVEPPVGGGSSCLVGTWKTPSCGGSKQQTLQFNSNGSGSFTNPDCNNICEPLVFPYNYTVSGSSVTLNYTSPPSVMCTGLGLQQPPQPSNDTMSFTCSGSQLTTTTSLGTVTYTK